MFYTCTEDETDDLMISNEDVTASLRESVTEDLEKGKAVKNQISQSIMFPV